jgi:Uma2 family endonuclease
MESALRLRTFTEEEYLDLERKGKYKSEFIEGQIYAMAGASPTHSLITANVIAHLVMHLKGNPCRVFSNDLKVRIGRAGNYYYPDLTVGCGQLQFHDEHEDVLLNPTIIVEVLSPSTEADDRGRKWIHYQQIESLTDYIMVSQNEPFIEHYSRQADGGWHYESCADLAETLTIRSIDCQLSLADVYDKVDFAA